MAEPDVVSHAIPVRLKDGSSAFVALTGIDPWSARPRLTEIILDAGFDPSWFEVRAALVLFPIESMPFLTDYETNYEPD
jgi:hypothetical protein